MTHHCATEIKMFKPVSHRINLGSKLDVAIREVQWYKPYKFQDLFLHKNQTTQAQKVHSKAMHPSVSFFQKKK